MKPCCAPGVPDDLVLDRVPARRASTASRSTSSTGMRLVGIAEQAEPRRLQRRGLVDQRGELREAGGHDAAAVEPDRRRRARGATDARNVARPPKQNPTMPMCVVVDARVVQVRAGGVDVGEQSVVGQPLEQRQHLGEVVVRRGAATGAMEDVESETDVAGFGDRVR